MSGSATIDKLIICSPYEEPKEHWHYDPTTRTYHRRPGRRPAGYLKALPGANPFEDPGVFYELELVNRIRERVKAWREAGYPGVTATTRRLLEFWHDPDAREQRFFFCQLEAIETLIWLAEAPPEAKVGIDIPGDGGPFPRYCAKMATGTGKTVVMGMLIAWHVLNKIANPQDTRFSKNILVIAPGLTVRDRLKVLVPSDERNIYDEFQIVPPALMPRLHQGRVLVKNWHALNWETADQIRRRRSVDKRGPKSDQAYAREVLGDMARGQNLVVINDEAHHAWRIPPGSSLRGMDRAEAERATKWIGGLDRIHRARGILCCYDFTATPFVASGRAGTEESLFGWIVSDFGLNDAIESGLVKTPRVVVRDDAIPDAKTYLPRLYHLYNDPEVKDDLSRKAPPDAPLPDLVVNAYMILGADWLATKQDWEARGFPTPPVMITVCNRTETAARIKHAIDRQRIPLPALCDPDRTLHIDSKVLAEAEEQDVPAAINGGGDGEEAVEGNGDGTPKKLTKEKRAELLRRTMMTVGRPGEPGEKIQHVISVGMLSEGWDAKTVTHIMGLRAFSSQLLCEQVVGRGLRRTSYDLGPDGLFAPEYVNIIGIPFHFLPHEGAGSAPKTVTVATTRIEPVPERAHLAITFPNVVRIEHVYRPRLDLDWSKVQNLQLDARDTITMAELGAVLGGRPSIAAMTQVELKALAGKIRFQELLFRAAAQVYDMMEPHWPGDRVYLIAQVIALTEQFLRSRRIRFLPENPARDPRWRQIMVAVHINKVVKHLWDAIRVQNAERLEPVFDDLHPIRSTADVRPWYTAKKTVETVRSHLNRCVCDSPWEAAVAEQLDASPHVEAWVKNDRLGFEIGYIHRGVPRKYRPDFLVRLSNGKMLILEVKGEAGVGPELRAQQAAAREWVQAVNAHGAFGEWAFATAWSPYAVNLLLESQVRQSGRKASGAEPNAV